MGSRDPSWRSVACSITLVGLVLGAAFMAAPAGAAALARPTALSSGDPFSSCQLDGTSAAAAEVEPFIAADPHAPNTLVSVWQQDRFDSGGGSRGAVAASSHDGGRTWDRVPLPLNRCVTGGLDWDRVSDPWVDFGPDGTVYVAALVIQPQIGAGVAVTTSHDGGRTWDAARLVFADSAATASDPLSPFYVPDKPTITADPTAPGTAYLTFTRFAYQPDCVSGTDPPCWPTTAPAYVAKTTDWGVTWTQATVMVPAFACDGADSNQLLVDPTTGALYDVFSHETHSVVVPGCETSDDWDTFSASITTSLDGGATWTPPVAIAPETFVGVRDPETGQSMADSPDNMTHAAIDPVSGELYVAWQDARWSDGAYDEIALTASPNRGATWTCPVRANLPSGRSAFVPSVAVAPDGTVGVSYYDFRSLQAGNTTSLPTTVALHRFTRGLVDDLGDVELARPFDAMKAPSKGGDWFLGDYEGLVATPGGFRAAFAATTGQTKNPVDIFTAVG